MSESPRATKPGPQAARPPRRRRAAPRQAPTTLPTSPFPDFAHPSATQCAQATQALRQLHGTPKRKSVGLPAACDEAAGCGDVPHVLDALVQTILSQNTTNANSTRAMQMLQRRFGGNWQRVWQAPLQQVSQAIACGGLGTIKAQRIKKILDTTLAERGTFSLDHLHTLSDEMAHKALMLFDGVGPKTASCVLLFCLGRDSFAVDTHVFRIAKLLGWIPKSASREQAYLHLDARVPQPLKYDLHVLLVRHGKCCVRCAPNNRPQFAPKGPCPLEPVASL